MHRKMSTDNFNSDVLYPLADKVNTKKILLISTF